MRLADTYYAGNELNEAIAIYNKTEGANDYTQFQKAMAIGFKGDTEAKIVELKKLISNYKNLNIKMMRITNWELLMLRLISFKIRAMRFRR